MKSLNKIACFLMLCWMAVIFMFSAEPDTESSELSGSVSYRIVSVVNTITASHWDETELLGSDLESNMTDSTKKNLAWRVDCEFGATNGKFELAACAKKNGLDAIHDTVHEMARDEARHGKALEGMLKRYFGK